MGAHAIATSHRSCTCRRAASNRPPPPSACFPASTQTGLTGGAIWYDYQTLHPDRLTWTVALAAERAGATLVNYVSAIGPARSNGRIAGAEVRDELTGATHTIEASATLLAAGGGLPIAMQAFGVDGAPVLVRAMNLLLNRPARDIATAAPGPSGRMLTAVPWSGFILVGTHQSVAPVQAGEAEPPAAAVDAFLADANATFPTLAAEPKDIRMLHHGLTPAGMRKGRLDLLPDSQVLDHAAQGHPGVVSVVGVKFTTARETAARAVDTIVRTLGKPARTSRTDSTILPHAGIADAEGRLIETLRDLDVTLDRDVIEHLTSWYSTEATEVIRFAATNGDIDRVHPGSPVLAAELGYAVEHAQAHRLADAVLRRTSLGSAGHPGRAALERASELLGARLHWTEAQRAAEITAVESIYPATARRTL